MKTTRPYETRPFKVSYVLYGEAIIYATSKATANMKIHEMTSHHLVEKSHHAEWEVIDTEPERGKVTA